MSKKILIDASHLEETRVVALQDNILEEFDFESEHKKQLKGNIYLARITRVEPSLQAAFVEYGESRHGFLAFSEIHPDYYQIPQADRQEILKAQMEAAKKEEEALLAVTDKKKSRKKKKNEAESSSSETDENGNIIKDEEEITVLGEDDSIDLAMDNKIIASRKYKIQDVIKRRQIILVQVVKEERGNKGAALTTYLSLAGRYSVLMPNTARGGGISRKITGAAERQHLKKILQTLEIPEEMGIILRTAGAKRSKLEIKRDYEYLMRLWGDIRQCVFNAIAPCLVHEEGSLIKRCIRDLYTKDITEILVSGDAAYREAKNFMRMLMPSQSKRIQPYKEPVPIFTYYGVEKQLSQIFRPQVTLKSGGYLIINQTEALVSIDVNSGRSTKESSVEDTALQTNLEAAETIARQLRLRDLAGLVVIDFIDMCEKNHIRMVEKRLKDCLKNDRARIQVGSISLFGLLEMSRQRIRASILENMTQPCPHCEGAGYIKSDSSVALQLLRSLEEYALANPGYNLNVQTSQITALYLFNNKRLLLADIEKRFGIDITLNIDHEIKGSFVINKTTVSTKTPMVANITLPVELIEEAKVIAEPEAEVVENNKNKKQSGKAQRNKEKAITNNNTGNTSNSNNHNNSNNNNNTDEANSKQNKKRHNRNGKRSTFVPYPEPVGPISVVAFAELRARRLRRRLWGYRIPSPELVNMDLSLYADIKVVSNKVMLDNFNRKKKRNNNKKQANLKKTENNFANQKTSAETVAVDNITEVVEKKEAVNKERDHKRKNKKKHPSLKNNNNKNKEETANANSNDKEAVIVKAPEVVNPVVTAAAAPVKVVEKVLQAPEIINIVPERNDAPAESPAPEEKKKKHIGWWQRRRS